MAKSGYSPMLVLAISIAVVLLTFTTPVVHGQGTRLGFYSNSCPQAESIVASTVRSHFQSDPSIAPGLLRMHFHDCFVRGCDASVLLAGSNSERTSPPNLSLKGFEVIDDAKTQLEAACPGVVSCADILALAARDSVVMTSGLRWGVPTGRRDGTVSVASEANDLPGFTDSIDVQKKKFSDKGLNTQDLVTLVGLNVLVGTRFSSKIDVGPPNPPHVHRLQGSTSSLAHRLVFDSGGHTIGTTQCQFFSYRLFNFSSNGPDSSIDPAFVSQLQALCPQNGDGSRRVGLDNGSPNRFDTSFFSNLRNGRGILESDQKLWTDASTRTFVQRFLGLRGLLGLTFNAEFGKSMVKMGNIEVKTGTQGEIRKVCSVVN